MSEPAHQPFYCEENMWHLAADPRVGQGRRRVILVTNEARKVAVWQQRAGQDDEGLAVWDYHAVLCVGEGSEAVIWDLDSRLGAPVPLSEYVAETFRDAPKLFAPCFRVIDAAEYRDALSSDRRHMRDEAGDYIKPPPSWPCIGQGHTLPALLDLSVQEPGRIVDLETLIAMLG